ncbi:LOW QUALITY PROTEIN: hypothetical protein CRUP_011824 [Coryphaenoides rupestris]|nr:LOW QUALITY PROTEIN: hypothetical protein CRUP_011824 [Coryphaenoides rupestris]
MPPSRIPAVRSGPRGGARRWSLEVEMAGAGKRKLKCAKRLTACETWEICRSVISLTNESCWQPGCSGVVLLLLACPNPPDETSSGVPCSVVGEEQEVNEEEEEEEVKEEEEEEVKMQKIKRSNGRKCAPLLRGMRRKRHKRTEEQEEQQPLDVKVDMEGPGEGRPWGKLVKVGSCQSQVLLVKRESTVGRRKGCDLPFPANKLVSGEHCKIVRDESSGMVWLEDMSTNGTVINMSKLVKKQTHMLQNGDVIHFVYRKNEPEQTAVSRGGTAAAGAVRAASPSDLSLSVEPVLLRSTPRDLSQEEPQPSTSASTSAAALLLIEGTTTSATTTPVAAALSPARGSSPAQGPSAVTVPSQEEEENTGGMEPERKRRKTTNGCDLPFPANKLVSGEHCKIVRDESSGMVWLEDMSTNGTVINMSKLVKKQTHMLQNGDVIHFVYRKNEPEQTAVSRGGTAAAGAVRAASPSDLSLSVEPVLLRSTPRDLRTAALHLRLHLLAAALLLIEGSATTTPVAAALSPARGSSPAQGPSAVTVPSQEEEENTGGMEPERKRRKTTNDKEGDTSLPHASGSAPTGPARGLLRDLLGRKAPAEEVKTDKMEESLTCIICQDLLHDCVSLQPCMHTFCAACYSGWMERSSLCPTCRCPVERIRKNHILNNLDMLQPKVDRCFSDEEGSSDYPLEFSDNDSDGSDIRQCPGYKKDVGQVLFATGSGFWVTPTPLLAAGPPGATAVPASAGPEPREEAGVATAEQPSTSADGPAGGVCLRPFCHMYWGCERMGCQGCLAHFNALNLSNKCLDGVLNSNNYESEILQNYLSASGLTWRDVLQQGLQALEQGAFHLSDYRISGTTVLCYCCGQRTFKELAYRKFNHICEQTRFKS